MVHNTGLYHLMTWLSPGFPIGSFTFSHGIEYAVERGLVKDRTTLQDWIEAIITRGSGRVDSLFFRHAWQSVQKGSETEMARVLERAVAMRPSAEMALESQIQGEAFVSTLYAVWQDARLLSWLDRLLNKEHKPAYPVAVGVASAAINIVLESALLAYLHAFGANLVSAGVRLIPLGQTDGQRIIFDLKKPVAALVEETLHRPVDDWGTQTPMVDWTSIRHETQYTRLFRS